jgi:hypothetical protein
MLQWMLAVSHSDRWYGKPQPRVREVSISESSGQSKPDPQILHRPINGP